MLWIEAKRRKTILNLALPIIGGMLSQNVLNLVDTRMVAELGDSALAAVGMGGFISFMSIALIMGLATGVQTLASRRFGEGKKDELAIPLNGGLLIATVLAIPIAISLFFLAPTLFSYLNNDPEVIKQGAPYLQARLMGMVAVGMNFAFRGYWNGVNLSKLYLRTLLLMHACNMFLNWVFIFGNLGMPKLGATGAGLGTAISVYIGTAYYFYLGFKYARKEGFLRELPSKETFSTMLRLGIPAALQQFFFAAGMTAFFWIVGRIGTTELAATNVLINLLLVVILPGIGFGLSAATLVGQALGRKDKEDAKRWGWEVTKLAALLVTIFALPGLLFPDLLLSPFLHDPRTLELARWPLRLVALTISLDTVGVVLLNALFGAGDSRGVMIIATSLQWLFFIPTAYFLGPYLGGGMLVVWSLQILYRGGQALVFMHRWKQGKWANIEV